MTKRCEAYDLMWHTTAYGPYYGDIGLGVGMVSLISNTSTARYIYPAFLQLDSAQDKKLTEFQENSGPRVKKGSLCPEIEICKQLDLVKRKWQPEELKATYRYQGTEVVQRIVAGDSGVYCQLKAEKEVISTLRGASFNSCKITRLADGLHVIESHPVLAPNEYRINFSENPDSVTCGGRELELDSIDVYDEKAVWIFVWDKSLAELEITVEISRSFNLLTGELAPLSKDGTAKITGHVKKDFAGQQAEQKRKWNSFFEKGVPVIECPDARVDKLNQYMAWVYRSNIIQHGGVLSYPYSMAKQHFIGWWMWDTAKSAIAGAWYGEREAGWGGLLNTENLQYPEPHKDAGVVTNSARYHGADCWYSEDQKSNRFSCLPCHIPEAHGSGTHPPMYSLAMWSLWKNDGNDKLMKRLIGNALAYDRYFENVRTSEQVSGLLVVKRWSDSGMDNSKRWANENSKSLSGHVHYDDVDWEMPVISVDVNAYNITEKYCLAEMCSACGMEEQADELEKEAAAREEILHKELWNEEKKSYFDRIEADGRFSPIVTPTNLSPFMLKNLPRERIEPMLEWMFDEKHFWGDYPLPSITKSDPDYAPYGGYFMGSIWMSYSMDILRGLTYHNVEAAAKLFDKLVDIMLPGGEPSIYENHNPVTGVGICCPNYCWSGQLIDIIMRNMFAISYDHGKVAATSAGVPLDWDNWKVKNIVLHGSSYTVSGRKVDGEWQHEVVEN